mmetsp:Transcript_12073/g.17317  ORF Transcript_12073/g.17317 Transcript_12073/m.17317 type:complete len:252 (+) Transcript_12073:3-758(+)
MLVFVNRADAVPRLLGSPLPLFGGLFRSALSKERQSGSKHKALATLESYSHIPHTEVVWLNSEGHAVAVPTDQRDAVLHLHEAISLDLRRTILNDHGGDAYIDGLRHALAECGGVSGKAGRLSGGAYSQQHVPIPPHNSAHGSLHPRHVPSTECFGTRSPEPVRMGIPVAQGIAVPPCSRGPVPRGTPVEPGELVGQRVALCGLLAKPAYNGRAGWVTGWDSQKGRYLVVLDVPGNQGEEVTANPRNLELR